MGKSKKIIIGTVAGVTAAAVCVSGVLVWHHHSKSSSVDGVAYVMPIRDVNSAANTVSDLQFSGVVATPGDQGDQAGHLKDRFGDCGAGGRPCERRRSAFHL